MGEFRANMSFAPESHFSEFQNVEDEDESLLQSTPQKQERWINRQTTLYLLDLVISSLSPTVLWRLPAVAFAMSLSWDTQRIHMWTFLLPYLVALVCVGWPLLVGELGIAQCVRGSSYKAFGSLGRRAGSAGIITLMGAFGCFCLSTMGALAFVYMLQVGQRPAAYQSADTMTHGPRMCVQSHSFAPYTQPRVCVTESLWWTGDMTNGVYEGEGKCIAAPWGGSSVWYFDNHNGELPQIFQELPLYCGDLNLHRVTTGSAYALITRDAPWEQTGGSYFNWRMMLGFIVLWIAVLILCFLPVGVGQITRIILGSLCIAFLVVTFIACIVWYSHNPFAQSEWLRDMGWGLDSKKLRSPEVWGHAVVQCLLSLNLVQNFVPYTASKSPNPKSNVVIHASLLLLTNALFSYLVLWMTFLGFMSLTQNRLFTQQDPFLTVSHQVRNNPYGLTFSLMQTLFDNSNNLDGSSPRSLFLGVSFWLSVFVMSVVTTHKLTQGIVDNILKAKINWRIGWNAYVWTVVVVILALVSSIGCWFGMVWSFFVTFQHFLFNWTLPVFGLIEVLAIGWFFGADLRIKHYGRKSLLYQAALFFAGVICFTVCASLLWASPVAWKRWLGLFLGALLIMCSWVVPVFLVKSHDIYGRRTPWVVKASVVLFGSTDHLRKELNYRTCHQRSVWKLTCVWTLLIRFATPWLLLLAWFPWMGRAEQNWNWSPYRPFFNDQFDLFSRVEQRMINYFGSTVFQFNRVVIAVAWATSLAAITALTLNAVLPKTFESLVPADTDPNFWNVRQALELFASSVAHTQVPIRLRSPTHDTEGSPSSHPPSSSINLLSSHIKSHATNSSLRDRGSPSSS
eukprot:Gregarina_sp_Pseudo_9__5014@NODE_526_length_2645_cov_14_820414_g497_i0_p1_GENE_NODE_526_length_2645_cov_14_820414_g497_i0NODE_526_length_2645_cov_14_820414_g497_i0_p1_ORF_typecomplete_len849_score123_38SNF/PF00209_18/1_1e03SNF/PF00209_18/1_5e11_NODE_526_length_2645_cov_14_820414_g497_i0922638